MLTTLPPSCAVVMKSGNLNFQEPSGPLQACNGTALPFLNMFRAHYALHQERQIVSIQPLVAVGGRVVCRSEMN